MLLAGITSSGLLFVVSSLLLPLWVGAISNYDKQGISQNYTEGLPEFATVNGLESNLGDIPSGIRLNKTQIYLDCSSDFMNITLTFMEKFYGIVYADYNSENNDYDRTCRINGDGHIKRELILSLKGCGTVQSPARVFINNIVVRFHPGLEMDGDEVITVICRYPEPRVVNPPALPAPLIVGPGTPIQALQPLRDFEVLLIICAIIFLALLLLGFGCSYYCLKKRNIKVVRKRPASTLGSEITKASDPISMFSGLKIPRAHAVESSGSEQLTESIHTEYNSEESSGASEEEYHSTYSDQACEISEGVIFSQVKEPSMPEFDVKTIIKQNRERAASPESSRMSSDSELVLKAQEQFLTTILERTETNTKETLERVRRLEAKKGPPPVHARIRVHPKQISDTSELESESELSQVPSEYYEDDMCLESRDTTNALLEQQKNEFDVNIKTRPKEIVYTTDEDSSVMFSDTESVKQTYGRPPQVVLQPPPNMRILPGSTTQTITGTRPKQPPQQPDQVITRTTKYTDQRPTKFPTLPNQTTTTTNTTHYTTQHHDRTHHIDNIKFEGRQPDEMSQITTSGMSITEVHGRERFDVFIRVLDPPDYTDVYDEISSVFTEDERIRIKEVILQDVKVQKLIETATTTNDFIHIKNQKSLQNIVEPQKWDVLIRILQNPINMDDPYERESSRSTKTGASNQELRSLSEVMVDLDRRSIPRGSQINTPTIIYEETVTGAMDIPGRPLGGSPGHPSIGNNIPGVITFSGRGMPPSMRGSPGHPSTGDIIPGGMNIPGRGMPSSMGGSPGHPLTGDIIPGGMNITGRGLPPSMIGSPGNPSTGDIIPGGMNIPGRGMPPPTGESHYEVRDSSMPGMTTHEVNYYSSSPTRTHTITREFTSGGTQEVISYSGDPNMPSIRGEPLHNPSSSPPYDILAPIIHRVDEETGATIRRVIQSVSQQEGFDVRYGFPDSKQSPK